MSRDGRWIAFTALNRQGERVVLHDLETGNERVATNTFPSCVPRSFCADQSHLVFERFHEIVSWDLLSDQKQFFPFRTPVSLQPESLWSQVTIDATGTTLLYRGELGFVQGNSAVHQPEIYLRRLSETAPILVSADRSGNPAVLESIGEAVISPDAWWAAFQASDSDLVGADSNRATADGLRLRTTILPVSFRCPSGTWVLPLTM